MPSDETPKLDFTIYKLDPSKVKKAIGFEDGDTLELQEVPRRVADLLIRSLNLDSYRRISVSEVQGIAFNKFKATDFAAFVEDMLQTQEKYSENSQSGDLEDLFTNRSSSLVLMNVQRNGVYALTRGRGATYINKYAVDDFASSILTKLFSESDEVVQQESKDSLEGTTASVIRTNRRQVSFGNRGKFGDIKRGHKLELGKEAQEILGFTVDTSKFPIKTIKLEAKLASLKFFKAMSLSEVKTLIRHLSVLDAKSGNFIMNQLAPVKRIGIEENSLTDSLFEGIMSENGSCSLEIVGDNPEDYLDAEQYFIVRTSGSAQYQPIIDSENMISLEEIKGQLRHESSGLSASSLKSVFKNCNLILKREGSVFYRKRLFASIHAMTLVDSTEYFLYNGHWFYIPPENESLLNDRFKKLWDKSQGVARELRREFELSPTQVGCHTEDSYNDALRSRSNIIVGHKALIGNIELSDFMFKKSGTIFIVHSKQEFDAQGARVVLAQAGLAARRWQRELGSSNRISFLKNYYEKIALAYNNKSMPITSEEFTRWFDGSSICIVTSYLDCRGPNSRSACAKVLTCDFATEMKDLGFDFQILHLV